LEEEKYYLQKFIQKDDVFEFHNRSVMNDGFLQIMVFKNMS